MYESDFSNCCLLLACLLLLLFFNLQVGANVIIMVRRQSQYYDEEWEYCENIERCVLYIMETEWLLVVV